MRTILILILNLLSAGFLYSQSPFDSCKAVNRDISMQEHYSPFHSEIITGFQTGTEQFFNNDTIHDWENYLDDDPQYNKRSSIWHPVVLLTGANILIWSSDRYISNFSWARVGFDSWKYNLTHGWEWDTDRFGVDFLGHPYSGSMFFNAARSSGYDFMQSLPYAIFGSVQWKYFGENDSPTINDLITTSVGGQILGEMLYRISSNILDDTKRGPERVFREIFVGIVDPVRGVNRLLKKRSFSIASQEIYQKEPMKVLIGGGVQKINNGTDFGTGETKELLNISLVYGDPFENRTRKPFDYFESRIVLDNGDQAGKSIFDNISVYGLLLGKNVQAGNMEMLMGVFQHYDYFNNAIFELGNLTFSGGILSKLPVGQKSFLNTNLHLGIIPFGGYSTKLGPDTASLRDFNYGGGLGTKFESVLDFHHFINLKFSAFYYYLIPFSGTKENNLIGIIKPSILLRIYKNIELGFQYFLYTNDKYSQVIHTSNLANSEQKFVLIYSFENSKNESEADKYRRINKGMAMSIQF